MGVITGVSRGNYGTKHFGTCGFCKNDSECFARNHGRCRILLPEEDGEVRFRSGSCSFKKPDRDVTDGKIYSFVKRGR